MLPVRVKVLSTSSCSLSQASSLLQRFLSGDACCDSLTRDYGAKVATSLHDSISGRARDSESSPGFPSSSPHFPSSFRKERAEGKHSNSATGSLVVSPGQRKRDHQGETNLSASNQHEETSCLAAAIDNGIVSESVDVGIQKSQKRHKRKRRSSPLENGLEVVSISLQEPVEPPIKRHKKERRRKERAQGEMMSHQIENSPQINQVKERKLVKSIPLKTESFISEKEARKRKKRKGNEDVELD